MCCVRATAGITRPGRGGGDFLETKQGVDFEVLEAFHEVQARYVGEAVRFHHDGKPEAGAQLARLIGRDTAAWKGDIVRP
jgi:hypothetical protein